MQITESILTKNSCYLAGRKINVKGLMLHSVGCSQPSANVFVRNWNNPTIQACVHGFIDANTGGIYQTLPWKHRGWHAGGKANDTHIGVEMCEPDCITYTKGASFTCTDINRAKAMVERTYKSAVELFAHLCAMYSLNPLEKGVIIAHNEGFTLGLASNHADPEHLWKGLKMPYTMDGFRRDVYKLMTPSYYRVQVGAFSKKENAEQMLNKLKSMGFEAFITH
jgi:N-acetyl-anhydromuramyl-L-alanine amidase AmpD